MSIIDNSKIFISGTFDDADVKVPAKTTYKAGTVLGLNADGDITAFTTENDGEGFAAEPTYILANDIVNEESNAVNYPLCRVFLEGEINKNKVIFVNEDDAETPAVLAAMKNNGFILRNVQEVCEG